jgi:hypothetical protein
MTKLQTQEKWDDNVNKARDAIQELIEIQSDCQDVYNQLLEPAQEGARGATLQSILDLDFQYPMDVLDEAAELDMP